MDITRLSEDALAEFRRCHVGIVFQNFHLVPTMTARENAALPIELAGDADAFPRAEAALAAVGLDHRLHHYPSQLSGGEQQRVALARAFAPEPALLLADEPTGNLDGETGAGIIHLLFDLHRRRRHDAAADHPRSGAGAALRADRRAVRRRHRRRPARRCAASAGLPRAAP